MPPARAWIPTVAGAGAVLLALTAAGGLLAPDWRRHKLPPDSRFDALREAPAPPRARPLPIRRERTRAPVAGGTLAATVIAPVSQAAGAPKRRPAMVFVHGGGPATAEGLRGQAEQMARAGVVTLVYDKRRDGYSFLKRDYGQLADDALAMARLRRQRPDVDPERVGLWGISEGGWVVPLAASRSPDIGFVILAAAPTMSPGDQLAWAADEGLRRQSAPGGARTMLARVLAMGGLGYADHDPIPALERIRQPVLALYPAADRAVPPAESARILADALERGGNRAYTIRFFAGADHGMRVDGRLAPGYLATMAAWVTGLPRTADPPAGRRITGARPEQTTAATPAPATPWYGAGPVLATAFGLVAVGYLAGPAAAAARRWRRRAGLRQRPDPAWARIRRRLRWTAFGGVGVAVGINLAIGGLATLAFTGGPGVAAHGIWLALRLTALATAVLSVAAVVALIGAARDRWRPDGVALASLVGTLTATGAVLLLAAYWGLYEPRW